MPAQPSASFIVVEPDFPFAFCEDDFDRRQASLRPHAADAHQFQQGDLGRSVAEVEFDIRRVVQVAPENQPDFRDRQAPAAFDHSQEGEIAADRTFPAFLGRGPGPGSAANLSHHLLDSEGFVGRVAQAQSGGMTAAALPARHVHFRAGQPHLGGSLECFAFKEPETWGTPTEVIDLEDGHWGKVHLGRWQQLHEKQAADVPYAVIRACVHLEREKPPAALWLAQLAPAQFPAAMTVTLETIWRAYVVELIHEN